MNMEMTHRTVEEFKNRLLAKSEDIEDLKNQMSQQDSCMDRFMQLKYNGNTMKLALRAWQRYTKKQRDKNRVAAYTRNTLYRRKMKLLFSNWRQITHQWFKERLVLEEQHYRQSLES